MMIKCCRVIVIGLTLTALACSESKTTLEPEPGPLLVPLEFASVAAGVDHTCAIVASGDGYCWGRDQSGSLGNDTLRSALSPRLLLGRIKFAQITAGDAHTCAIDVQGNDYCWGDGERGQLGLGDTRPRAVPTRGALTHLKYRTISAGGFHTCAVLVDGRGFCWGWNPFGQVGNNSTIGQVLPAEVHGDFRFAALSAGYRHTCAVTLSGSGYCWGEGRSGQLGQGTFESRLGATPVIGGFMFVSISAGSEHSCGIVVNGAAYCWGAGEAGQLGNGVARSSASPVAVAGSLSFVSIDASAEHTCGVSKEGELYCWGHNNYGRLGTGALPTIMSVPTRVQVESAKFKSAVTGRLHTCGLTDRASLYCWGFGGFGQLGNGTVHTRALPTRVVIRADSAATN